MTQYIEAILTSVVRSGKLMMSIFNVSGTQINPSTQENQESKISTANSTEQELAIGATFTGVWEDITNYSEVIVSIYAVEASATDGLKVEWSADGITSHGNDVFTISATSSKTFSFPCQMKYMRVVYTNNGTIQSNFVLQTSLKRYASKGSSHRLKDTLVQEDDAIVTKSLVAGKTTGGGGGIIDVKVTPSGALTVEANVSNQITGYATETKQDVQITNQTELSTLVNALYELTERLTFLTGVRGVLADLRVTPTGNVGVTGTLTGVTTLSNQTQTGGYFTNPIVQGQTNLNAVQSNISNILI